ncbi:uncharacterized protein FIBRA_03644 [Fibroporia radiculosa]|uniref:WD40 repeat-like protein n=1 Tax=Fibroporia radiculosa TaxID=599839 RepID=J4H2I5_9APHY|nr:uncharacterized protein FIBRA_03644 [Fibroporia radiculosa]CCM01584.1 predicted protein [Fibroporia radiculosa]
MRNGDSAYDYPFACDALIYTGHRANIFNAQMLPNSSRIATVAGDKQVRISDIGASTFVPAHSGEIAYSSREANIHVLRCHNRRVKRIVTEESPDLFLTVAEDGTVRQHDLRAPHNCHSGSCPAPLVRMNHELNTIALSPLTPYQFVVAGESPYGYLFDRRHAGKSFQEQWGMAPDPDGVTTCVRRFGRATGEQGDYEHITGARMANSNGHEVLLSYSSDAVYLYSTLDNSQPAALSGKSSSILRNNDATGNDVFVTSDVEMRMEEDIERILSEDTDMTEDDARHWAGPDEEVEKEEQEEQAQYTESRFSSKAPIVLPRSRFAGACNVETVKDVNFLGPRDEFVVSGSDDGNFFIWDKVSGRLCDILEGDSSVVNVVEGHPHLPLVAVSGIDTTVKARPYISCP